MVRYEDWNELIEKAANVQRQTKRELEAFAQNCITQSMYSKSPKLGMQAGLMHL